MIKGELSTHGSITCTIRVQIEYGTSVHGTYDIPFGCITNCGWRGTSTNEDGSLRCFVETLEVIINIIIIIIIYDYNTSLDTSSSHPRCGHPTMVASSVTPQISYRSRSSVEVKSFIWGRLSVKRNQAC